MQKEKHTIIAIDDDQVNLEILQKNLRDNGYKTLGFENGESALNHMKQNPEEVDVILLDKMMPGMDGMEVLQHLKSHAVLREVPVIMQTGDIGVEEAKKGLAAGAYYYLEKPFQPAMMVSLVGAAVRDQVTRNDMLQRVRQDKSINTMIYEGIFHYRTLGDAKRLAAAFAWHSSSPDEISLALSEIMVNSVEHGNLEITYDEKTDLLKACGWEAEVEKRLKNPSLRDRIVVAIFKRSPNTIEVTLKDQGRGFDWKKFLEFDPLRLTDPNGRGIATAKLLGLQLEYIEDGSAVKCSFTARKTGAMMANQA